MFVCSNLKIPASLKDIQKKNALIPFISEIPCILYGYAAFFVRKLEIIKLKVPVFS